MRSQEKSIPTASPPGLAICPRIEVVRPGPQPISATRIPGLRPAHAACLRIVSGSVFRFIRTTSFSLSIRYGETNSELIMAASALPVRVFIGFGGFSPLYQLVEVAKIGIRVLHVQRPEVVDALVGQRLRLRIGQGKNQYGQCLLFVLVSH